VRNNNTTSEDKHRISEKGTILVIDDEQAMRDSCREVLTKDGYRIETAEDGDSGLDKVREIQPDLVLVDLKMPGLDGMEVLERINEIDPNIVSVVITAYATIESAVEAMKRHAYDFLTKPFTPDQLRVVIKRGLERRRLAIESARLQQEKEVMKKNFITLVSHQLRSPLASVKQYFGVLREGFAGEVSSKQREMIEKAGRYVDDLLQLINDWLNMSRIDAGDITNTFETVDLVSLFSNTIELLEPLAETRKVALKLDLCDSPSAIEGDPESLKGAFTNLISNGINYNREGGTVTVSMKDNGEGLVVEIRDTGIGISRDNLHFIFDEFFREKRKEARDVRGSGLGLPIAKRIIEAHDGFIKVASEVGKGSTFRVFLPKAKVKVKQ
jgi:two-component system sensor histidine kinase/response regulator